MSVKTKEVPTSFTKLLLFFNGVKTQFFNLLKCDNFVLNVVKRCGFPKKKSQGWRKASLSDSYTGGDTSKAIQWLLHMGCTGIYRSEGEQSTLAGVRHT